MKESDRPSREIVMELDVRRNQLYKWKEQLEEKGEANFSIGRGRQKKADKSELSRVKRDMERVHGELVI